MIFHPVFQRSILGISQIVEEATQKGLILNLRPFGEFRLFGLLETALLVFPEFRRQGIGNSVVSILIADKRPTFFVSATSNKASFAFFSRQSELVRAHQNKRYRVYQSSFAVNLCPLRSSRSRCAPGLKPPKLASLRGENHPEGIIGDTYYGSIADQFREPVRVTPVWQGRDAWVGPLLTGLQAASPPPKTSDFTLTQNWRTKYFEEPDF
jgi:hypothetical protein